MTLNVAVVHISITIPNLDLLKFKSIKEKPLENGRLYPFLSGWGISVYQPILRGNMLNFGGGGNVSSAGINMPCYHRIVRTVLVMGGFGILEGKDYTWYS